MTADAVVGSGRSDPPGAAPGEEAFAAALAGLPHLTPPRLRRLLGGRAPADTWALVRAGVVLVGPSRASPSPADPSPAGPAPAGPAPAGRMAGGRWTPGELARVWREHALRTDPAAVWAAYARAGVKLRLHGRDGYPDALGEDPTAPPVLFSVGSLPCPPLRAVALVGTRNATHYGEEVASELGAALARAGVSVVSGLALGIDGAAHQGALAAHGAPPLGVVASGLDVVYPPRNRHLWRQVAAAGALLSESPLGASPEAWRFPWRNRLIAALSDVVVVIESHLSGGSLLTAEAAVRRGIPVMAVPGSVRSAASAGTNALLADGCPPARDVEDVLVALGLSRAGARSRAGPAVDRQSPAGPAVDRQSRAGPAVDRQSRAGTDAAVWSALDAEPTPTGVVLRRTGLALGEVAMALDRLEQVGLARAGDGWWVRAEPSGPGRFSAA